MKIEIDDNFLRLGMKAVKKLMRREK